MEAQDYLALLKKSWIFIVVSTIIGTLAGLGYFLLATPKYEASTQLYVSVHSASGTASDLAQGASFSSQIVNSYIDIVKTGIVLQPVIDDLDLDTTVEELAKDVKAASPEKTVLINIAVENESSELAANIANGIAENLKRVVKEELEFTAGAERGVIDLTTTQPALVSEDPVSPIPILDLFIGFMIGLLASVAFAIVRDMLDTRIRSTQDVKDVTDHTLLGGVLEYESNEALAMAKEPMSPTAESYRALRTNLRFLNIGKNKSVFIVTSSNPGEGKSTSIANLALALAEAGHTVALLEADLRLPKLHSYLGVEGDAGLTDVLTGRAELEDVIEQWGRTSLYFIPSGQIPPNPSELLGSSTMDDLLHKLNQEYDYVLLDTPPVLSVTDATVIGQGFSSTLVAVASDKTNKSDLENALSVLDTAGSKVAGVFVTMLKQKTASSYGYGHYYGYKKDRARSIAKD